VQEANERDHVRCESHGQLGNQVVGKRVVTVNVGEALVRTRVLVILEIFGSLWS
jgi:hypothetical protein